MLIGLDCSQVPAQVGDRFLTTSSSASPEANPDADADSTAGRVAKRRRRRFLGWLERASIENPSQASSSSPPTRIPTKSSTAPPASPLANSEPGIASRAARAVASSSAGQQSGGAERQPRLDTQVSRAQDFLISPETRTAEPGSKANEPFLQRLYEALFEESPTTDQGEAAQPRRLPPAPYQSPPFPFSEHLGPVIGIRDDAVWPLMEALEQGPNGEFLEGEPDQDLWLGRSVGYVRHLQKLEHPGGVQHCSQQVWKCRRSSSSSNE